jgi:ABC-2 type transport system permease protein
MLWSLVLKEWRALRRDWHGLLVLFVMPSAFILIMSLALRDTYQTELPKQIRWHYLDQDDSDASRQLLQAMGSFAQAQREPSADRAVQKLTEGHFSLLLEIKHGFAQALVKGEQHTALIIVHHRAGTPLAVSAGFEASVQRAFALLQARNLLAQLTPLAQSVGANLPTAEQLSQSGLIAFHSEQSAQVKMTAVQQSVPAWLIFSMFFVVSPIANMVISEQQCGTLKRLRSMQVPMSLFLLSKIIPFYVVGLIQTLLMLLVGRYIVPLCGGDALQMTAAWWPLFLLVSFTSLAAIAFALLIACLARSTEQATTFGGVSNIIMAALGGVMVPKIVMPVGMQTLSALSPMSWPLDAFVQLFLQQANTAAILPALAKLALFALSSFALAVYWLQHRRGI